MQQHYFRHFPCGTRIPSSIHAVSVSMPTLQDVIGYEEKCPEKLKKIVTGYPRFVTHPYILKVQEYLEKKFAFNFRHLLILSSSKAALALCDFAEIDKSNIIEYKNIAGVVLPENNTKKKKAQVFLQHTGTGISSRWAEDILTDEGILQNVQTEEYFLEDAENHILNTLSDAYTAGSKNNIYLTSSGMNSIYSVYNSVTKIQRKNKKTIWIQFGWLFMDTMELIKKLGISEPDNFVIYNIFDIEKLESILINRSDNIAGIITEVPSNPLVQTPDIKSIQNIANKYNCIFVIDSTLGTPHNINVLSYADLIVESLTKYASGSADLMLGAIILNSKSNFYDELKTILPDFVERPYIREVKRLAFQIGGYVERMKKVNKNTILLVDFLKNRKSIKRIFWAYEKHSKANFEKIHKAPDSPGGIITIELNKPLETVYNRLRIAKGPSCGAEFTLVGPYMYLAHYDLLSNEGGRSFLNARGLNPELLRISVGIEKIEEIIDVFSEVL
jgi:cystathionine gamma-synthase